MIYLDNAATTRILPEVAEAMIDVIRNVYGNANSKYYEQASTARQLVESSRNDVARLVNVRPSDVIFNSGSTEGNNTILKGIIEKINKKHIITSKVEHSSIIETCKYLESRGFNVTYLDVNKEGRISIEQLENEITNETALVSIMWANNETGAINDVRSISDICNSKGTLFHSDATQAIGKVKIDLNQYPHINFITLSAHKFNGPKGVGALIINGYDPLETYFEPLLHGGDQELGLRGGTLPTHQIVGLGVASRVCRENQEKNIARLWMLENRLKQKLIDTYGNVIEILNNFDEKVPGLLSVRFRGINNQVLLKSIANNICASSGSACSNSKPSHVLQAMGFDGEIIKEVVRISLSPYDEYDDFEEFE